MGKAKKQGAEGDDHAEAVPARHSKYDQAESMAEAIRMALNDIGDEADGEAVYKLLQGCKWRPAEYTASFRTAVSTGKKKLFGGEDDAPRRGRTTPAPAPAKREPSLSDLLAVEQWLGDMSADDGLEQVNAVRGIVEQVGGFDALVACVEALKRWKQ